MINRMPELARAVAEALTRAATQPPHLVLAELLALARSAVAADFALILARTDPYTADVLASDPPDVIPAGAGRPELIEAALADGEPFFGPVTSRRIPAYLRGCHAVLPLGAELAAVIGRRNGAPWDEQEHAFLRDLRGALAPTAQWAIALRQRDEHKKLLDAVVDTLDGGVLVVDNAGGSWINGPGARLLGVPAGSVEPAAVAAALAALRRRSANARQLEQQAAELAIRQEGRIAGWRWVLGGEPHQVIEVASVPIHTAASGRLWLFADVTAEHDARLQLEAHEAALAASEAKYRTTFEQAADGMIRVSEDGRLLEVNSRFAAMLGWTPEELAGRPVLDLIVGSPAHLRKEVELQLYFQGRADLEQALRRRDGSSVTTEATVAPLPGGEYLVIVRDVTERRAAEREHAFLSAAVASSAEAIVGRGTDGTILSWNSGAEQIFGYTAAEAIGRHLSFFFAPESREQMAHVMADVLLGQTFSAFESRRVAKDGRLIDVLVTTSAVRNAQGQIIGAASIMRDISERKRAQEQVQRALDQLKLATDAAEIGIWTWDFASDQLLWDERMCAFYEAPEATRQAGLYYDFWRSSVHPDDREEAESSLAAARRNGTPWAGVFRIILPGDRIRYIHSTSITEYDPAGQALRMIGVNRDITRERQREEDLRAAQYTAEAANKAKTEYLSLINHELRTPLNAILGLAQIMQTNPDLQATIGDDLTTVVESGNHMLTLINEVLDLAKIEAGKAELAEKDFDLHLLLRTIHAMLQPKIDAKGLSFTVDVAPETPRFLRADEGKLRQVLINLLNNAVKFTNAGSVTLAVWSEAPGRLALRVTDTGAGIAPEQIGRLFKPFMQTDSARTQQEGTGLGLAISHSYVQLMGGDISVASTLGEGTSFQFDIRCQEASAPDAQAQARKVIGLAPGTPTFRILIVDDVYTNRLLLRRHLGPLGFELSEAVDGLEALAQWEAQQPDLIFLDIMLPKLDGGSVARIIREREAERAAASAASGAAGATARPHPTIIVAATASVLHHELVELTANGCDAVLSKPFARQELFDVLHAMLGIEFQYAVADSAAPATALTPAPGGEDDGGAAVLVVDDNAVNRKVAIAMLKRLGQRADAAGNGEEALEALRRRPYTLLLLDLQMPVMGGLEAARRIHQEWGERRPRLLAVTGGTSAEEQEACREAGMDGWLAKPLQLAELQAMVESLLP